MTEVTEGYEFAVKKALEILPGICQLFFENMCEFSYFYSQH